MAGVPLPQPPVIPPILPGPNQVRETNKAFQDLLAYLDLLRRQVERDYT